jgi:N6-adenosine-specific RNA methylase IME4
LPDTATGELLRKRTTDTRRATSKRARVSERKVKAAQAIKKRSPDLAKKVAAGEVTLKDATRQTKPAVRAEKLASAIWPEGKYGVMLADPPWKPDEGLLDPTRRIENQYPTMTLVELIELRERIDALALPDCVLLLWATTQKLDEATALIKAWGFVVKSGAVWIKDSIGMGYWFRGRHELLILATRGAPMTPLEANRPDSVIAAPRQGHSEKPGEVYALIERMFPQIPKVEIFARAERDGWQRGTNERSLRSA